MVTVEYSEAAVEVLGILDTLVDDDKRKIPDSIFKFLENNKSQTYNPDIDYMEDIEELKIMNKTREILAGIYLDYLCPEDKKQDYINKIRQNQLKHQEELKEKYNSDDIFKNKQRNQNENIENLPIEIKKEGFFHKLIVFIKKILK